LWNYILLEIVCLYGVPKKIVSDRGTQFTSRFWEKLHEKMDTKLNFSSAYHPQIDGQTERVNQILEDILRACALKDKKRFDKCLPYVEFSYNNSYQQSLKMSPFEVLYERCDCSTGPGPIRCTLIFPIIQTLHKFCNSNLLHYQIPKMSKICRLLDMNLMNNFVHWLDFRTKSALNFSSNF
jgi:transposase InsO family protein